MKIGKILAAALSAAISVGAVGSAFAISDGVMSDNGTEIQEALTAMTDSEKEDYIAENLDVKLRYLSNLVTLTSNKSYDKIADVVGEAIDNGLSAVEIKEAIYHSAAYCGYTRSINAMDAADAALTALGVALPSESRVTVTEDNRYSDGLAVQRLLFGSQIGTVTDDMTAASKLQTIYLSGICFGDFYTRSGLDLETREFLTFCTIAANGGCSSQARGHANGNINIGHTKEMLRAAVLANEEYNGEDKTVEALSIVNALENNPDAQAPDYGERTPIANADYTTDSRELEDIMSHYESDDADGYISANLDESTREVVKSTAEAVADGTAVPESADARTQALVNIVNLASQGDKSVELNAAVTAALADGCMPDEMLASILVCIPYNGYPRTLNATSAINNAASTTVAAADVRNVTMQIGNPKMTVDGTETEIDPGESTAPIIENERTLLPVRAFVEAIGGEVSWDDDTKTATLKYNDTEIRLTIDSQTAYLNGEERTLDVTPVIRNDRTMLPIRFIAESFGYEVEWSQQTQTVTISKTDTDTATQAPTAAPTATATPADAVSATDEPSYDEEDPDAEYEDFKTYDEEDVESEPDEEEESEI